MLALEMSLLALQVRGQMCVGVWRVGVQVIFTEGSSLRETSLSNKQQYPYLTSPLPPPLPPGPPAPQVITNWIAICGLASKAVSAWRRRKGQKPEKAESC